MENKLKDLDISWCDPSLSVVYNYWKKSLDPEQTLIAGFPNENNDQMLARVESVCKSKWLFLSVFKDSQAAAKPNYGQGQLR